jgi:hypothetical protein
MVEHEPISWSISLSRSLGPDTDFGCKTLAEFANLGREQYGLHEQIQL